VGICWDQWFPECARAMALQGADLLLYPTAIGSEPTDQVATPNTPDMWQRAMIGHAVHNSCYVAAANRIGTESFESSRCDFYGHSFICDYQGDKLIERKADYEGLLQAELDLAAARTFRQNSCRLCPVRILRGFQKSSKGLIVRFKFSPLHTEK
jgi:N-carbamoylputrescine amidase